MQFSTVSDSAFEQLLATRWRIESESEGSYAASFYDSFDWRLYQAGLLLLAERSGDGGWRLRLSALKGDEPEQTGESTVEPGMLDSLPGPEIGERLAPVLEMRRLLPRVSLNGSHRLIRVLDDEEKTLVRIDLFDLQASAPGREAVALTPLLRLNGLKGYEKERDALQHWMKAEGILSPASVPVLDALLERVGVSPADYNSKLNFSLEPAQRADAAAKHILAFLLGVIGDNLDGVRADTDSEFLHDLRVAVRRTRSALSQIKDVFEPTLVEHFKTEFGWIGQITGPTRDMDVYLLKFPDYRESLPEEYRAALEPFHRYLEQHQRSEQRKLARRLDSARFKKILEDWRAFLDEPVPNISNHANAVRPVLEVASDRIFRMYKRVMKEGKAIRDDSHPEELHELRKSCKKLRYLMEFFQSLYPDEQIKGLIKSIKVLLDNLGDFQDLEVQATKLRAISDDLRQHQASTETLLAIGMLIEGLLQRQHHERACFADRFKEFGNEDNRAQFSQLFKNREAVG